MVHVEVRGLIMGWIQRGHDGEYHYGFFRKIRVRKLHIIQKIAQFFGILFCDVLV